MSETTYKTHQEALYRDLPKYDDSIAVLNELLSARINAQTDFNALPPGFAERAAAAAKTSPQLSSSDHKPIPPKVTSRPTIEEALRAAE